MKGLTHSLSSPPASSVRSPGITCSCLSLLMQEGFEEKYKGKIEALERRVEDDYISRLQSQCFRERQYSKYIIVLVGVLPIEKVKEFLPSFASKGDGPGESGWIKNCCK